jgi:hypothetical protein
VIGALVFFWRWRAGPPREVAPHRVK